MRRVITYGTFDLFHQGHYNILKRAKAQGDYLIVGVTSESYDIERGKLNVRDSLLTRIENVRRTGFADEIIIEEYQGQKLSDILKYNIDVLVLGSDWRGRFDYLKKYCEVIYLERTKNISSTLLRGQGHTYRIGVVTDSPWDGGIFWESKYVSGLHTECVYSENRTTAERFCEKYELNSFELDLDAFLGMVDIVYVHTEGKSRERFTRRALEAGKYVICDSPIALEADTVAGLMDLARQKRVMLFEKITLAYLRAFNQLVWQIHGGLLGNIMAVRASVSSEIFNAGSSFTDTLECALCAVIKLLGTDWRQIRTNRVQEDEDSFYEIISIEYPHTIATVEVSAGLDMESRFTVIGSNGRLDVPDDWWNTGYFEARITGADSLKRFCFNFEGNGLRYLLQEMMIMMSDRRTDNARLFYEESLALARMMEKVCGSAPCTEKA